MKIIKVTSNGDIYIVTFKPNLIQRMFGLKEKSIQYKEGSRRQYVFGGTIYLCKDGKRVKPFSKVQEAIDNYRRSW